jgi:hypothetical protein
MPQINSLTAYLQLVVNQQILLIEILYELAKGFSRHVGAVENPLFDADEVLHKGLAVHVFNQAHIPVDHLDLDKTTGLTLLRVLE